MSIIHAYIYIDIYVARIINKIYVRVSSIIATTRINCIRSELRNKQERKRETEREKTRQLQFVSSMLNIYTIRITRIDNSRNNLQSYPLT